MSRWNIIINSLSKKEEVKDELFKVNEKAGKEMPYSKFDDSRSASPSSSTTNKSNEDLIKENLLTRTLGKSPERVSTEHYKYGGQYNQAFDDNNTDSAIHGTTKIIFKDLQFHEPVHGPSGPLCKNIIRGDQVSNEVGTTVVYIITVYEASKAIRLAFIRKVYGLLAMQLFVTAFVTILFMYTPPIREYVVTCVWLLLGTLLGSILLLVPLYHYRRKTPANFILLIVFNICEAITFGIIVTLYSETVVLTAVLTALLVFGGLTLFTMQTKYEYLGWFPFLFAGLIILIVAGILQIFSTCSDIDLFISYSGTLLFCMYIIFDLSLIMKHLSPEEYIFATITLYLDVINVMLYLMRSE